MTERLVVARNHVADSENRIHSDDVAQRYGFQGGLVAGVTVYAYLTYPLVERFGNDWLGGSISEVKLLKPAYDQDPLRIALSSSEGVHTSTCRNDAGELLAEMRSSMPARMPDVLDDSCFKAPCKPAGRPVIDWSNLLPMQPFKPWHWMITEDQNQMFAEQADDRLAVYHESAHPHWMLAIANQALVREYVLPAWIHVSSEIRMRRRLKVNQTVEVQAVPLDKWVRKGHQFLRLFVRFVRDGEVTTEILHTAIFRVAS
ncbi:MAG: hypothetical protein ACKOBM_09540 [Gammaproteobacteria bacterium]